MRDLRLAAGLARLDSLEARFCLSCNHFARQPSVRRYFRIVSRLGDGIAWYSMLAVLPLVLGPPALAPALHMGITALAGVIVYKILKGVLVRERPFASHPGVEAIARPLDRYSFPSGHTLHAACFLTLLAHFYPPLALLMLPFGVSVAASRVVLGLHYPSDVLAGALIGWGLARASLLLAGV
jgi:undecaprenyl-diphosphatase